MNTNVKGFTNKVIINQEAAQWVLLLEDTPELSKAQIAELNAWIRTSSVHRECLESMVNSWGEMDLLSSVMLPQEIHKPSLFLIMLRGLLYPLLVIYVFLSTCIKKRNQLFSVAFVSPLVICLFTWFLLSHDASTMKGEGLTFDTGVGESLSRIMPDGSTIWLNSSTKVKVNYTAEYRRINLLEGEAHFEVAKDRTRPFEVYADNRLVRATGTAFTVHKVTGAIEVLVSEGTVELAIVDNTLVVIPDDYQALKIEGNFEKPNSNNDSTSPLQQAVPQPVKVKKLLGNLSAGQRISIPTQSNIVSDIDELDTSEVSRFLSWKKGKLYR